MFTADLSWTDPTDEKVGERKERIARERSSSSQTPSLKSSGSSGSSSDLWQPSWSLKRPKTKSKEGGGSNNRKKISAALFGAPELPPKDSPVLPPRFPTKKYSSKSLATVPSLSLSEQTIDGLSELEGDPRSRRSNSQAGSIRSWHTHSRNGSSESRPTNFEVIDEMSFVQQLSPRSFVARTTSRSAEATHSESYNAPLTPVPETPQEDCADDKVAYSVEITGCSQVDRPKLDDRYQEEPAILDMSPSNDFEHPHVLDWRPPSTFRPPSTLGGVRLQENEQEKVHRPERAPQTFNTSVTLPDDSDGPLTHFQRFIRRMASAGPKLILDRLNEKWADDEESDDELILEKQLWILTAFQLQRMDKSARFSHSFPAHLMRLQHLTGQGKILELYGNIAEVYQLSAMQPKESIHHLSTRSQEVLRLPDNVAYLTVPHAGITPFPYAPASFNYIRASTLPSLMPSSKLPQVFRECYRLLSHGGILEVRLMDAFSNRRTTGPLMRAWIEDRLALNLEKSFRCSRPCMLVPSWMSEAGFCVLNNQSSTMSQTLKIPCAHDPRDGSPENELATLVARALWKDIWGDFVDAAPGEPSWWWEDKEVVQECLERQTFFECGTYFASKE